jgi:hypothetical protein
MTNPNEKSIWHPPDDACSYKRVPINYFTKNNFWYWKTWRTWWASLTLPPWQNIISRNSNNVIATYNTFSTDEAEVVTATRHIRCVATYKTPMRLDACKFMNKNDTLAYTELSENMKPKVVENIENTDFFNIHIENEKKTYILREKNHCGPWGIRSLCPWLMIIDNDGHEIMGASYSCDASGIRDALLYLPTIGKNTDLFLAVLVYYVCEAEFYRQI